jgi:hypothetical protein
MTAEQLVSDLRQREPMAGNAVTAVKVHDTLACVLCDVAILVLEVQAAAVRPTCCGRTMRTARPAPCSAPAPRGAGAATSAGCYYVDEPRGLVVRCTRSGSGVISCAGKPMTPLPG